MYQVEDEPMETIHLYVVREGEKRPSLIPVIISFIALSILIAIGVLTPYQQPEQRASLRVPAVPSFMKMFSTAIKVVPTGVKSYPATFAHGVLTITNGSILSEELPKGLILTGNDGIEVATDSTVFVPAGSATGYGVAYVSAHAMVSGNHGNISADDIDSVEGSSIYIRNLQAFIGGKDAYSVTFATQQDKVQAITQARALVASQIIGLHYPCRETITTKLIWHCQFITFYLPAYMHIISAVLQGDDLVVTVWFMVHPKRIWMK